MNTLKPGFIPKTWERGELLIISQAPGPHGVGCIMQATAQTVPYEYLPMAEPFLIQFRAEDAKQVQAWVDWWYKIS